MDAGGEGARKIKKENHSETAGKARKLLTNRSFPIIILAYGLLEPEEKDRDEDSRTYKKIQASRGRCKPGMSRICLKITSESQIPKRRA